MSVPGHRPILPGTRAAALLLALAGAGCTVAAGGGAPTTVTVRMPGTLPPPAQPPSPQAAPPLGGSFAGTATLSSSAGSGCRRQMPISHFVVTGDRVRYQGFRGTIGSDGAVQMQAGGRFLYGSFDGGRFVGHYWQPHPECTYDLVLNRTG